MFHPLVIDLVTPPKHQVKAVKQRTRLPTVLGPHNTVARVLKHARSDSIHLASSPEIQILDNPSVPMSTVKSARSDSIEIVLPSVPKPEKKPRLQMKQRSPSLDVLSPMQLLRIPGSKLNDHTDEPVFGLFQQGMFFKTWEEARDAIYKQEEARGHKWIKHQTKMSKNGSNVVQITFHCNRLSFPTPKHSTAIDPSDLHYGKSS